MILAIHYSWSICIVLFNVMVLNITSFGPKHININTMIIGKIIAFLNMKK